MVPPLWMVSHRYGPRSSCTFALGEEPRLYHNTPGQVLTLRLMSRWSSGYLLDHEPRGSASIPEVTNLEIFVLRIPSKGERERVCVCVCVFLIG